MLKMLLFSYLALAARDQGAHVHGFGSVSIAFDGNKGQLQMEFPAESLFGFEHQAKTKKDINIQNEALKKLEEEIGEMIVFESSLGCKIIKEKLAVNQEKGHADVDAGFLVNCTKDVAGSTLKFHFQKVFPGLKKLRVEVITESVQKSKEVSKNGDSLELK